MLYCIYSCIGRYLLEHRESLKLLPLSQSFCLSPGLKYTVGMDFMFGIHFSATFETFLSQRHFYRGSILYEDLIADPSGEVKRGWGAQLGQCSSCMILFLYIDRWS